MALPTALLLALPALGLTLGSRRDCSTRLRHCSAWRLRMSARAPLRARRQRLRWSMHIERISLTCVHAARPPFAYLVASRRLL